jgi:hypothetical protein
MPRRLFVLRIPNGLNRSLLFSDHYCLVLKCCAVLIDGTLQPQGQLTRRRRLGARLSFTNFDITFLLARSSNGAASRLFPFLPLTISKNKIISSSSPFYIIVHHLNRLRIVVIVTLFTTRRHVLHADCFCTLIIIISCLIPSTASHRPLSIPLPMALGGCLLQSRPS